MVAQVVDMALCDDTDVDIGARAQVIIDASLDGICDQLDSFLAGQVVLVARLKHCHGIQAARAHRAEGQAVCGPMRIHLHQ